MVRRSRFENRVLNSPFYQAKATLSLPDIPRMQVRKSVQFTYDIGNDGYTGIYNPTNGAWLNSYGKHVVVLQWNVLNYATGNLNATVLLRMRDDANNQFAIGVAADGQGGATLPVTDVHPFKIWVPPGYTLDALALGIAPWQGVICESLGLALRVLGG